jgi:hypothetical protein
MTCAISNWQLYSEPSKKWRPEKFFKLTKHFNSYNFSGQGKKMTARTQKGTSIHNAATAPSFIFSYFYDL